MSVRIEPTVGRIVHLRIGAGATPLAGIISAVNADGTINVGYWTGDARHKGAVDVPLVQDGEPAPKRMHATWMAYQKGQAAKTEQLQSQVDSQGAPAV
jgi:hypothetical protein